VGQWEVGGFTQRVNSMAMSRLGCEKALIEARWAISSVNRPATSLLGPPKPPEETSEI